MTTENIIKDLLDGNISDAKEATENLLYAKVNEMLNGIKEDVTDSVYGMCEAKKKKDDDEDEDEEETKYAKDSDAENDSEDDSGETLDAVGDADSDVDNDGDSDESDAYLKNRRKVRKKDIEDEEEIDEYAEEQPTSAADARRPGIGSQLKYNKLRKSKKAKA